MKNGDWSPSPRLIGHWSWDGLEAGSVAQSSGSAGSLGAQTEQGDQNLNQTSRLGIGHPSIPMGQEA